MSIESITIEIDGRPAAARLARPEGRTRGGIILYMDAFGLRPALDTMAERMAASGFVVLVPDLFHRHAPYGPFDARTAFAGEATRAALMDLMRATPQEATERDSAAFLAALSEAGAGGPVAAVGYCMGGGRALTAAAAYPDRIVAAASFHGGNLASDAPDSPHRRVGSIKGRVYVGVAAVDGSFPPEQSAGLAEALRRAEVDHAIEVYPGAAHGWCVPDHSIYDEANAERHWRRLGTLFDEVFG